MVKSVTYIAIAEVELNAPIDLNAREGSCCGQGCAYGVYEVASGNACIQKIRSWPFFCNLASQACFLYFGPRPRKYSVSIIYGFCYFLFGQKRQISGNEHLQTHTVLEGFTENGLYHVNKHICLHRIACIKTGARLLFNM